MISNSTQPNKDLKPTMTGSYELGLEMKFFNSRLGLDVTYYNQNSKNQILSLASTTTSGYSYRLVMPVRFRTRVSNLPSMVDCSRLRTSVGTWVSTSPRIPTR